VESKISMNEQRYNYNKGITNERKSINILKVLAYIAIFTSSFDMAFNFKISGFNFRLTQISMIILSFFVFSKILGERKLIKPINIGLLLIYVLLNTVFLYNAIYKKMLSDMNYGYY
jgi:hypothetical protein